MSIYPGIDDKLVVRVPGQVGPGYKGFNNTGDAISFPPLTTNNDWLTKPYEIDVWFKPEKVEGAHRFIQIGDYGLYGNWNSYSIGWLVWDTSTSSWKSSVPSWTPGPNIIYNVKFTHDGEGNFTIYLDGNTIGTFHVDVENIGHGDDDLYIGASPYKTYPIQSHLLDFKITYYDGDTQKVFQLGDMVGTTVFDYQGGLVGTASGNITPVQRKAVWALDFDGTGYVDCGNGGSLVLTNKITVMAEIKFAPGSLNTIDYRPIITKGNKVYVLQYRPDDQKTLFTVYDSTWHPALSDNISQVDIRYCFIGNYDGLNINLYVNGIKQGTSNTAAFINTTTDSLNIGRDSTYISRTFLGLIYLPVIIYARAITDTEQKLLTQRRFDEVSRQDCVLWLDYDPDFYASTGKLKDFSGYGNHGTLVGGCTLKKVML